MTEEKLLTPAEVAARLQLSKITVLDYLRRGHLKGVKLAKHWRVREEDLQRFIVGHLRNSVPKGADEAEEE
jgi:excisionase family DNA binding protein